MRYDGSINFDTRIDSRGFNRGIRDMPNAVESLKRTFENLAKTIGIAFSVGAVLNFSKACLSANQTQIEAEARLGATMRNTIKATKEEIQSVKELASELQGVGIVGDEVQLAGMQELATYVENAESLKTMLPVLDDMIAQQYGYNATTDSAVTISTMLGKVLQGQTSALSRYGYSFDEAQEKLLKYGTEEERVATLAQVVSESVGGVNKALADTPTGKMKQLSNDFGDLQETLGNMISNIIAPVVKWLDVIVVKLNTVFSSLNQNIKGFFGISDKDVGSFSGAVDEVTESIEETEKATKKLEKNLAGIDKLNVLNQNNEEKSDDTATALPTISSKVNTEPVEASVNILTEVFEKLKQKLQPVIDAVKRLKEALEPLKKFTFKALEDFYTDFLRPIGDWVLGKGLPKFIDIITDLVKSIDWDKLNKSLDDFWKALEPFAENIGNGLLWFLDEVLSPIAEWTINDAVPVFLDTLTAALNGLNSVINSLKQPANWLLKNLLEPLGKLLSTEFSEISIKIPDGVQKILDKFSELITALHPFFDWLIKTINPAVLGIARGISIILSGVLDFIIDVVSGIIETLTGIVDFLTGIFTTDWDKVWKGIKEIFGGVFDIIKGIVVGIGKALAGLVIAIGGTVVSVLQGAWDIGANLIKGIFKGITDLFGNIGRWIKEHIVDPWINSFKQLFGIHSPSTVMAEIGTFIIRGLLNGLKDKFVAVLDWLKSLPEKFTNGFSKVVEGIKQPFLHIADWFKDTFSKAWQKVKDVFSAGGKIFNGIKEGITNVFKTVVNGLIGGINNVIAVPFNAINAALNGIKSIEIVGLKPFDWIEPFAVPQIPKLATGTVVPASYGEFMAILGDNKREPEIVSPVSAMKQAFKEAMAEMKLTQNSNGEITVVLELDGEELFRKNVELNKKYKKRHGGRSAFA